MKKNLKIGIIIGVVIVAILVIALIIIINSNKITENDIKPVPVYTSKKMANYIDIMSGNYYMKYKVTTLANSRNYTGGSDIITEYATLNGKTIINEAGSNTSMLVTDDAVYYIMHSQKEYYKQEIEDNATTATDEATNQLQSVLITAYFEEAFVETGTESIAGTPYYYEEYKPNKDSDARVRYYFDDNDKLKYMKNTNDAEAPDALTEILEINKNVTEDMFEIPEDYKALTLEELYSSMYGEYTTQQ